MPEWSNGSVSKTDVPITGTAGSNPALSAMFFLLFLTRCLDTSYVLWYYPYSAFVKLFGKHYHRVL